MLVLMIAVRGVKGYMEKGLCENRVHLIGKVVTPFVYSHSVYGENFYTFHLEVLRKSGNKDIIPIMLSNRLLDVTDTIVNKFLDINGQFRSYNKHLGDGKTVLVLYVFVNTLEFTEDVTEAVLAGNLNANHVLIEGQVCRKPLYRKTPLNKEVCDLLLAINRPYKKADYIPCIAWGRNALFTSSLDVSSAVYLAGRIQSRSYFKKEANGESIQKIAYEVSVFKISKKKNQPSEEVVANEQC